MKQKYIAVLLAFPIFFFSTAAFAATAENVGTGTESENSSSVTVVNERTVENTNEVSVSNRIEIALSTGGNNVGGGMPKTGDAPAFFGQDSLSNQDPSPDNGIGGGSGSINTGDAVVAIRIENRLNENETGIGGGEEEGEPVEEDDVEDDRTPDGIGGGDVALNSTNDPANGIGGGPSELAGTGTNSPLAALMLAIGTLATLYLFRKKYGTLNV